MVFQFGLLVVEAAHRSGTSVTAKYAKEQGKTVFALPHEIKDIHGVGTNKLIKQGAKIVSETKDIIEEFPFLKYKENYKSLHKTQNKTNSSKGIYEKMRKRICKNKNYNEIYDLITEKPITLNEIYKCTNKSISEINNILLMLELEGYIKKIVGGYVCVLEEK